MSSGMYSATATIHLAWHVLYHDALFETNRDQIPQKIDAAERAILYRIKELFTVTTDHIEEDVVLDDALYALRALRTCVLPNAKAAPGTAYLSTPDPCSARMDRI